MKFSLDQYAHLNSVIHRWNHRLKFLSFMILIFAFAFVNQLLLLPLMVLVTAVLYKLSNLPFSFLLSRLRYPGLLIASVVVLLPFLSGRTVLWQWGWIEIKEEGCLDSLRIITRFICILTVSIILFGTAPFLCSVKALRSFGLPSIIVDVMVLTYRYLEQLGDNLTSMQQGVKLRGFEKKALNKRTAIIISQLVGTLLVRSYEQSKRIYQAMILKGYNYQKIQSFYTTLLDNKSNYYTLFCLILFVSFAFIWAEATLNQL